jgi:arylsulfatase A-like enzyme
MSNNAMTRRGFLAASASAAFGLAAPAKRLPNIVYILADDLGYGDLGCYNPESKIPTPNIDRFASQGVRFLDAHSPSAVCTPTRYGILTGRYCWRSSLKKGVLVGDSPSLIEPGRLTVPEVLKQRGFETAGIGKWHLGLGNETKTDYTQRLKPGPNDFGFDYWFGIPASLDMQPYVYFENDHVLELPTQHIDGIRKDRGVFWREGSIAPGFRHIDVLPRITREAVSYVNGRDPAHPFFLYFAMTAPHTPWLPTPAFEGKAKAGEYGDFVAMVDDAVGQVLGALERRGLVENTLVIVTSDNGAHWLPDEIERWHHRANAYLRGQKADIWDGGHRIPFLARWPGRIHPGTQCDQTICLTDLMGTVAELTHFPLPRNAGEDSYSILPALMNPGLKKPIREATVHHSANGHFSIRQGEWKLNLGRGSGGFTEPVEYTPAPGEAAGELFNLREDPAEANNLYLKLPGKVAQLSALLNKYQTQGYSRPMRNSL